MEYASKNQKKDGIHSCQASDENTLDLRFPIVTKEGNDEEWDVHRDEYRDGSPPGIYPNESRGFCKEDLHHRKEGSIEDGKENPVWDSQDFHFGIFG